MKISKVLSIFLVFVLIVQLQCQGNYVRYENDIKINSSQAESFDNEEKIENRDFSSKNVLVIMNEKHSKDNYSVSDFKEIACENVSFLTKSLKKNNCTILSLELQNKSKENVLNAIKKLESRDDVYLAEPDYLMDPSVEDDPMYIIPNDPYYQNDSQWAIDKIELPLAWNFTTGSSSVKVGVIDTGIKSTHPDLQNRVDLTLSTSFSPDYPSSNDDSFDHGTRVASVIGAQGNNNVGVVGVCWNVKLVSLKVVDQNYHFINSAVISAINYAEEHNIKILNYSGSSTSALPSTLKYAIDSYSGLFLCCAGNEGINIDNNPCSPAGYKAINVITVGASTKNDTRCSASNNNSNYGAIGVDIFAPGTQIYTCSSSSSNLYVSSGGTSLAVAFVTGVAALLLSSNPNITVSEMKTRIMNGSKKVTALNGLCLSGGRLNAFGALSNANSSNHTHNFVYCELNNQTHTIVCSCGYTSVNTHLFTYTHNSTQHTSTCFCGYTTIQPHTYNSYSDYNYNYHKATCVCGYFIYESHTWVQIPKGLALHEHNREESGHRSLFTRFCSKCGRFD